MGVQKNVTRPELDPAGNPGLASVALGGARSEKVCVHHLTGVCRRGMRCADRHPVDAQFRTYAREFKRKTCRYGDQCFSPKCLYYHPREDNPEDQGQGQVVVGAVATPMVAAAVAAGAVAAQHVAREPGMTAGI